MKNLKIYLAVGIVSFLAGRFIFQPEPKTIFVEKKQEKEKSQTKKVITSRETKKPDGTVIIDTVVKEDTKTNRESKSESKKVSGKGVTLGLLAVKDLDSFQQTNVEAVAIIPIYGKLNLATSLSSDKRVGLGVALEF